MKTARWTCSPIFNSIPAKYSDGQRGVRVVGIERGWPAVLAVSSERLLESRASIQCRVSHAGWAFSFSLSLSLSFSPPRKKKSRLYGRMRIGHLFLTGSSHGRDISSLRPVSHPPSLQSPSELNFYRWKGKLGSALLAGAVVISVISLLFPFVSPRIDRRRKNFRICTSPESCTIRLIFASFANTFGDLRFVRTQSFVTGDGIRFQWKNTRIQ